jgi:glycerophosphoryl diester phosphodiesterase
MPRPLLLGHRGARATHSVPENTFASFDLALAHGCDGFEFDIRGTADGRAVVCHDPEFEGVSIAQAHAGQLHGLPQLEQVLARYASSAFLDIELKVPALEEIVLSALQAHPPKRGYVVSSFLPQVLGNVHSIDRAVPLGLLCEDPSQLSGWPEAPVQYVLPHFTLIDEDLCTSVHSARKKIFAWTVNGRETMQRLRTWGVDGLISDDTQRLVTMLKKSS